MDSKLTRVKELIEQKEVIDSEPESLIAGGPFGRGSRKRALPAEWKDIPPAPARRRQE